MVKPSDRLAYKIHSDYNDKAIYIPLNRLNFPYQTEKALNPDKVQENVKRIIDGKYLQPVIIGYSHDVHDGHHRVEAAKRCGHTHVPCVVKGRNPLRTAAAEKRYRQVWKSVVQDGKLLVKANTEHWVTITKDGPLKGRHIKIDGNGRIVGGKGIPRHLIDQLNSDKDFDYTKHTQPTKKGEEEIKPSKPAGKSTDDKNTSHVMTREEATKWAQGSKYTQTFYHGTTKETAGKIREGGLKSLRGDTGQYFGAGVYLTGKKNEAQYWGEYNEYGDKRKADIVETKVRVHNPLVLNMDDHKDYMRYKKLCEQASDQYTGEIHGKFPKTNRTQWEMLRDIMKEQGYDALRTTSNDIDNGGDQLVVFDPRQIAVIAKTAKKSVPVLIKGDDGRWVTITKDCSFKGARIKIDTSGHILEGELPPDVIKKLNNGEKMEDGKPFDHRLHTQPHTGLVNEQNKPSDLKRPRKEGTGMKKALTKAGRLLVQPLRKEAVYKEPLPPGGQWVTIHHDGGGKGHKVYILNGKIIAGGLPHHVIEALNNHKEVESKTRSKFDDHAGNAQKVADNHENETSESLETHKKKMEEYQDHEHLTTKQKQFAAGAAKRLGALIEHKKNDVLPEGAEHLHGIWGVLNSAQKTDVKKFVEAVKDVMELQHSDYDKLNLIEEATESHKNMKQGQSEEQKTVTSAKLMHLTHLYHPLAHKKAMAEAKNVKVVGTEQANTLAQLKSKLDNLKFVQPNKTAQMYEVQSMTGHYNESGEYLIKEGDDTVGYTTNKNGVWTAHFVKEPSTTKSEPTPQVTTGELKSKFPGVNQIMEKLTPKQLEAFKEWYQKCKTDPAWLASEAKWYAKKIQSAGFEAVKPVTQLKQMVSGLLNAGHEAFEQSIPKQESQQPPQQESVNVDKELKHLHSKFAYTSGNPKEIESTKKWMQTMKDADPKLIQSEFKWYENKIKSGATIKPVTQFKHNVLKLLSGDTSGTLHEQKQMSDMPKQHKFTTEEIDPLYNELIDKGYPKDLANKVMNEIQFNGFSMKLKQMGDNWEQEGKLTHDQNYNTGGPTISKWAKKLSEKQAVKDPSYGWNEEESKAAGDSFTPKEQEIHTKVTGNWYGSSTTETSMAMRLAVQALGLSKAGMNGALKYTGQSLSSVTTALHKMGENLMKAMVSKTHKQTQKYLKKAGGGKKTVTIYRGVSDQQLKGAIQQHGKAVYEPSPAESWTTNVHAAYNFGSVILKMEVPIESILWTHDTRHSSFHSEHEWIHMPVADKYRLKLGDNVFVGSVPDKVIKKTMADNEVWLKHSGKKHGNGFKAFYEQHGFDFSGDNSNLGQ